MRKIVSIVSILLVALAAGFIYLVGFKIAVWQTPLEPEILQESPEQQKIRILQLEDFSCGICELDRAAVNPGQR
jgi:hypothetical protein